MKKLAIAAVLMVFLCAPAFAQNSCDSICNAKCKGQGATFMSCFQNCKSTCVAKPTGDSAKDKSVFCENRCAGKGAAFKSCYDSCLRN